MDEAAYSKSQFELLCGNTELEELAVGYALGRIKKTVGNSDWNYSKFCRRFPVEPAGHRDFRSAIRCLYLENKTKEVFEALNARFRRIFDVANAKGKINTEFCRIVERDALAARWILEVIPPDYPVYEKKKVIVPLLQRIEFTANDTEALQQLELVLGLKAESNLPSWFRADLPERIEMFFRALEQLGECRTAELRDELEFEPSSLWHDYPKWKSHLDNFCHRSRNRYCFKAHRKQPVTIP